MGCTPVQRQSKVDKKESVKVDITADRRDTNEDEPQNSEIKKKADLIFQKYDTDKKGYFTLKESLQRDGKPFTEDFLWKLATMIDTDQDGHIRRAEIIDFYLKCH